MPPAPSRSPYDQFASIYNRWMAEDFCRRAWSAIERLWISRLPEHARVLDLCCGTGQMAHALSERGFRVMGIDISEQMLRLARQNAPRAEFMLADARHFALASPVQGALSAFNSVAHLHSVEDLQRVFRNVRSVLVAGAPFLFDISMEEAYTTKWRGRFDFSVADCTCIVEPAYDPERHIGRNRIVVRQGTHRQSAEFWIEQRCHSEADLRTALLSAGFTRIEIRDAQRDLGMAGEWGRSFFLCS